MNEVLSLSAHMTAFEVAVVCTIAWFAMRLSINKYLSEFEDMKKTVNGHTEKHHHLEVVLARHQIDLDITVSSKR